MFNKGNKAVLSIIFYILDIITIIFVYDSTFQWDQWGLMFAFLTMPLALVALSLFVVWFILMLLSLKKKKLLFIIVPLFLIISFALSFGYGKIKIHMYNKNNNESLATEEDINKYKESFDLLKNDEMISCSKSDNHCRSCRQSVRSRHCHRSAPKNNQPSDPTCEHRRSCHSLHKAPSAS